MKGKNGFFLFIVTIFLLPNFVTSAPADHVVIQSFKIAGETSTDEFVELYNPSPVTINLSNWRLSRKTASGSIYNLFTTLPIYNLEPGKSLFIAHKNVSTPKDLTYTTATSLAEDNTIVLFSDQGKTTVDKVGFGKAGDFEGKVLINPKAGEVYARKVIGEDSGNNETDFALLASDEDGANEESNVNDFQLFITEIMPNPSGTDTGNEWIEIYNPGERISLAGIKLTDKEGSVKNYTFPEGKFIDKESYAVFYSRETGISLNNETDAVELMNNVGKLLDDTDSFEAAKEGHSFAYDGERWVWTTQPTPGAENIISTPEEKGDAAKAIKTTKPKAVKKAAAKKPPAKKAAKQAVLGAQDAEDDLFSEKPKRQVSEKDRLLGYILIVVALVGGLLYTLFVNKEKLLEVFNEERSGYKESWRKFWEKLKRR